MTKYENYLHRRLGVLNTFLSQNNLNNLSESSIVNFHQELKKNVIENKYFFVTSPENQPIDYFGMKILSRYQRQGHMVLNENFLAEMYSPFVKPIGKVSSFFTHSCQGAHYALFLALKNMNYKLNLVCESKRIYFETSNAWKFSKVSGESAAQSEDFYLIDSAFIENREDLFKFEQRIKHRPIKFILFDTTCFDRQSSEITDVINKAVELQIPLIITRSHLKLDSMGVEYGSLGSIFFLNFNEEGEHQEVLESFYRQASLMGVFAPIASIYPFLIDQNIKDLASLRVSLIQENSKKFHLECKKSILGSEIQSTEYLHNLYYKIFYPGKSAHFLGLGETFLKLCQLYQVEGKFCDSFAFDFFSLTNVESFEEKSNLSFLRFCPPVNPKEVENSIKIINQIIEKKIKKNA